MILLWKQMVNWKTVPNAGTDIIGHREHCLAEKGKMPLQAIWLSSSFGLDGDPGMNWLRKFKPYYMKKSVWKTWDD